MAVMTFLRLIRQPIRSLIDFPRHFASDNNGTGKLGSAAAVGGKMNAAGKRQIAPALYAKWTFCVHAYFSAMTSIEHVVAGQRTINYNKQDKIQRTKVNIDVSM